MNKDFVDHLMERWQSQRPDLDVRPIAVVGRAIRIAETLKRELKDLLKPHGLEVWEFDVLATLRWRGKEVGMTPKELIEATMVTSGTMTNRIDRLEKAGFVRREPNPDDRRSVRIVLADPGIDVVEQALTAHIESAHSAVVDLTEDDRESAARILRQVLARVEPPGADPPVPIP